MRFAKRFHVMPSSSLSVIEQLRVTLESGSTVIGSVDSHPPEQTDLISHFMSAADDPSARRKLV